MYLNAYYIHQYHYVLPPRHIEWDCAWMRDHGFDAISFVINEVDLKKTDRNIDSLFRIARTAGLKVHLVPSRWGALVAGTPGMKSRFSAAHPEACLVDEQGRVLDDSLWGPMASVHHPATMEFFQETLNKVLDRWPFDGIIWDEPKLFDMPDLTSAAKALRPPGAGIEWDNRQFAAFFDRVGAWLRRHYPALRLSMFIYATAREEIVEACAQIRHLDDLGCDGSPFPGVPKTLMGHARAFQQAARRHGKRSLMLIENIDLTREQNASMDRHLPELLAEGHDHVLAYYYGRNCEAPDEAMDIVGRHLSKCRRSP